MGLREGTGILLDPSRYNAPLSRKDCCPSYLLQIEDNELRQDILDAMDVSDDKSLPNYDLYSLNFGYAHLPCSWSRFIDIVAIHERRKDVVIVLNQWGAKDRFSTTRFTREIFTQPRCSFLEQKGFGKVFVTGGRSERFLQLISPSPRILTVVLRPRFLASDVRLLQLASERLLTTGDNSASEALCAKCKIYLYEDVGKLSPSKKEFLEQQKLIAKTISPTLCQLLSHFVKKPRLSLLDCTAEPHMVFEENWISEAETLLSDPTLSEATFQFCQHITKNYDFEPVLEAAMKRAMWHHIIPELSKIEAEALDQPFRQGLIHYLEDPEAAPKTLTMSSLSKLSEIVKERVFREICKEIVIEHKFSNSSLL